MCISTVIPKLFPNWYRCPKPKSDNIQITFSTDPINQWSFIYSLEYFSNEINDHGGSYSFNIIYEPLDWFFIDLGYQLDSYYDKYHFLKIQPYTNIPDPPVNNIIRLTTTIKDYYFSKIPKIWIKDKIEYPHRYNFRKKALFEGKNIPCTIKDLGRDLHEVCRKMQITSEIKKLDHSMIVKLMSLCKE